MNIGLHLSLITPSCAVINITETGVKRNRGIYTMIGNICVIYMVRHNYQTPVFIV